MVGSGTDAGVPPLLTAGRSTTCPVPVPRIAVLLGARRIAEAAGVGFVLDSPTPPVQRVLEIAELDAAFAIR
ncbi:MAG: hypothetical protein ACXW2C_02435 [Acidimicrobiia bacterium]